MVGEFRAFRWSLRGGLGLQGVLGVWVEAGFGLRAQRGSALVAQCSSLTCF